MSDRVSKEHSIQHGDGLLPVGIILNGGGPWSEDKVLRVIQGISWPPVPRFSVRVKMVDKIDEGRCQRASTVNIKQVRDVCLGPRELVDRRGKRSSCVQNRELAWISWCCSLE